MPASRIFVEGGSGQSTGRRRVFGQRIVVRVFDDMGAWMPGEEVQFSLPPSLDVPSGRFPGGAFDFTEFTDSEGRAFSETIEADDVLGTWLGSVSVVAAPAVKSDFYLSNVVTPFTPATVQIVANGTQAVAQFTAFQPVTARLLDGVGAGVAGEMLTMTCPAGTGTFPGGFLSANAFTDANGFAVFPPFTASGVTGSFDPIISFPSLATAHADFTTVDPAIPVSMSAFAGNNQHTPPGIQFAQRLVVRVANGINAPVAGVAVTWDAPDTAPTLVWKTPATDPTTAISDASGLATSPQLFADATAGTYDVFATSPGIGFITFQLTNGGASPFPDATALQMFEV